MQAEGALSVGGKHYVPALGHLDRYGLVIHYGAVGRAVWADRGDDELAGMGRHRR